MSAHKRKPLDTNVHGNLKKLKTGNDSTEFNHYADSCGNNIDELPYFINNKWNINLVDDISNNQRNVQSKENLADNRYNVQLYESIATGKCNDQSEKKFANDQCIVNSVKSITNAQCTVQSAENINDCRCNVYSDESVSNGRRIVHTDKVIANAECTSKSEERITDTQCNVQLDETIANNQCNDNVEDNVEVNGDHETQESGGGEADLHKYLIGCKKNPGHKQFIPVDKFSLKHLPEGYQDNDLYELIKVIADLTVRVDVKMISPQRPKFWPHTNQLYPFYNMNTRNLRTGSGRVWIVNRFQDGVKEDVGIGSTDYKNCRCRECQDTDSPSNVWWEFDVFTATHVVYDDTEASHATVRFFYDREDSPVVSVKNIIVNNASIEDDWCMLKCVTCDKGLGDKLMKIWKTFDKVWEQVRYKYFSTRDTHRLNFIVSHPHGCCKQISIGQWKDKLETNSRTKFTYNTCTCPGSSGAHVQCVGYSEGWSWGDLVHSGTHSGLNYSGQIFTSDLFSL
ncbi:uncharacterized protein LOC106074386 isoform X1 [Biomphalaria glabrata]|uniref:Uncharacterized protein LOC106074386 isoform X1 n=1 Tax=Biomphalaria glabrata TaxID=6526 RepID=A0A9W3B6I2_BIOGL|nr:uncharacterized protein LOC106074386 isoform X1 [Biomphalaria glabrata]KAI8756575.1 hypothetical protein BgiMline_010090 [Biomphalaria glabrata]